MMLRRSLLTSLGLSLLVAGCGAQVPIGQGQNLNPSTGGASGAGGTGGSAGAAGGTGGSGGSTGGSGGSTGGSGGSTGGSGGSTGGSGGSTGGSAGAGGGASCPTVVVGTDKTIAATNPSGIAADATDVYWTTQAWTQGQSGGIWRADKTHLVAQSFASSGMFPSQPNAFVRDSAIQVSGGRVYWSSRAGIDLWSLSTGGGALKNLYDDAAAVDTGNVTTPETLAIYAGAAYWAKWVIAQTGTMQRSYIMKVPLSGGAAQALVYYDHDPQDPSAPAVPGSMSVDASGAYFTLPAIDHSTLERVTLDGASANEVAKIGDELVADGSYIYAAQDANVLRISKTGGAVQPLYTSSPNDGEISQGIVEYSGNLYVTAFGSYYDGTQWTSATCGWVHKVPLNGGAATVIWAGVGRPYAIAADADGVYWTDINQNTVHVLRP